MLDKLRAMETLKPVLEFITNLPWYAYLIAFIGFAILFGKKKEWEYEANLIPEGSHDVVGEIELKKYHKQEPEGEIEFNRHFTNPGGRAEVYHNNRLIAHVDLQKLSRKMALELQIPKNFEPQTKDTVEIRMGSTVLKGVFHRD